MSKMSKDSHTLKVRLSSSSLDVAVNIALFANQRHLKYAKLNLMILRNLGHLKNKAK